MDISQDVYCRIVESLSTGERESGGLLGDRKGIVEYFEFDLGIGDDTRAVYRPDVCRLNYVLAQRRRMGIRFCGMVHSHPAGQERLSSADHRYISTIMATMPKEMDRLYFPLVLPEGRMIGYVAERIMGVRRDSIRIVRPI